MPEVSAQDLSRILIPGPGKLLVQVKKAEEINRSGLWLSDKAINELQGGMRPTQGIVVACGDDDDSQDVPFAGLGDKVVFGKYSGVEMSYGRGERVILLKQSDILAKYSPEASGEAEVKIKDS